MQVIALNSEFARRKNVQALATYMCRKVAGLAVNRSVEVNACKWYAIVDD